MGYSVIKSFERGIDTRRMIDTTEAGALLDARDCHITRGGEIEKRAAFVVTATLPASTVGLFVTRGPTFHTWGIAATAPAGMPGNGVYHPVPLPSPDEGVAIEAILSVEEFGSKIYAIIKYVNGLVRHWYDDVMLLTPASATGTSDPPVPTVFSTTEPGLGQPQTSFYVIEDYPPSGLLNALTMSAPGAPTPIAEADYVLPGATRRSLIPYDAFSPTHGYFTITGYIVSTSFPDLLGAEIAALINAQADDIYASASAEGRITVWVNQQTAAYNGWTVSILGVLGLFHCTNGSGDIIDPVFSGGVDPVPPDPDPDPAPGVPIDVGTFVLAHNEKLYATKQQFLNFTALRDADGWFPTAGSGYIDHTMMGEGQPNLVSLADYGGDLAVFADRSIFIWRMDPDPLKNFKRQVLHRTGTIAPHSVVSFGQNEVMYLDRSGIRSLRQRESTDSGFASDLGNNIDDLVTAKIKATSTVQHEYKFWGDVEPTSGRLWMGLYDIIYVLSYFPGNRIAAWTWYDASAYPIDMMNATDEHMYWRSGDNVIVYGGESGDIYDDTEALVRAPYIDAGKPAHFKTWSALDAALYGTWQIRASFDPTQPTAFDLLANVIKSTYAQEKIAVNGKSPSLSLELRSTFVGPARIGNAALHYEENYSD